MPKHCVIGVFLGLAPFVFANAPLPGSSSYLGIYKPITVTSFNGANINGGGAFNAKISNFATTVWCVDDQLYFSLGSSGHANVIGLNTIVTDDTRVRYGNVHNGTGSYRWTNQTGLPDSAQERYRMAAYLITQFDFRTPGNAQSGLRSTSRNTKIQNTIWSLTNNNSPFTQAVGVRTPDQNWLSLARANYTMINLSQWAVVSWTANANGTLGTRGYGSPNDTAARQTFLVQVVPEPSHYVLLGIGVCGLLFAHSKRSRSIQSHA
jgi:hypothetical protein